MAGSELDAHVDPPGSRGRLLRLRPLRVLVVSSDERFRAVCSMLLARRGCEAFSASTEDPLTAAIGRERIDVLVVEDELEWAELSVASASLEGFSPPAGLVAVAEQAGRAPCGRLQLAKWGPFDQLFAAIERAELRRAGLPAAGAPAWPLADRRRGGGV